MDQVAVKDFYDHFHAKVVSNPTLYINGSSYVDIILPTKLIEYANAASGHTGFGSGARARGIRRETSDPFRTRDEIFLSVESLARFLNSSEMDAEAYIARVREGHANLPAKRVKTKLTVQQVLSDFNTKHGAEYNVKPSDAKTVRKAMEDHLKTITNPTDADMMEAVKIGFEPFKK